MDLMGIFVVWDGSFALFLMKAEVEVEEQGWNLDAFDSVCATILP